MRKNCGIFVHLLVSFGLFAAGLAFAMTVAGYICASNLSLDLLARRCGILVNTLIQAEKQARSADECHLDSQDLVSALDLDFLIGKQLHSQWSNLPDGMNVLAGGDHFVFLKRVDGVPYALCGSLNSKGMILDNFLTMFLFCGTAGLLAAIVLGSLLARRLASPLQLLANTLEETDAGQIAAIPEAFVERADELGTLARIIRRYQEETKDYIEREKSFVGAASHELRTPLTVIANGLELLETQIPGNAQASTTLRRLARTASDMCTTVSALLCLARGEKRPLEKMDVQCIFLRVLHDISSENFHCLLCAEEPAPKRISMQNGIIINAEGMTEIWGEPSLAAAVFRNLLENALRHSGASEIFIGLAKNTLEIRNKVKFAADNQVKSGFGLMIARRACNRMNWRLIQSVSENEMVFKVVMAGKDDAG